MIRNPRTEAAMREIARVACVSHEIAWLALDAALKALESPVETAQAAADGGASPPRLIVAGDNGKATDKRAA